MVDALDSRWQRFWLLALLLLWGALLLGGFVLGDTEASGNQRIPTWARMTSSLTLVVASWSWSWFTWKTRAKTFSVLLASGMTAGFIGDLTMADLLPALKPPLGGIAAFGLGHGAYCAAMIHFGNRNGLAAPGPRWVSWVGWLFVGAIGWILIAFPSSQPASLRWGALPYTLLLASTAGLATGLAVQAATFIPLAFGGGLFLLSDLILAGQLFDAFHFPLINAAVWLTYGPAQMFIVYSVNSALKRSAIWK
jgi:hypothetical protein